MRTILAAALMLATLPISAQITEHDLPNHFTDQSVIPHGCLSVVPSVLAAPPADVDHDETLTVFDGDATADVRVRAWRIGCHEPARTAIALNFKLLDGSTSVRYPTPVLVSQDGLDRPAGLFHFGRRGYYAHDGVASRAMADQSVAAFVDGVTLIVDMNADEITTQKYNGLLVLRLEWPLGQVTRMTIPDHDELTDDPQFADAPLHGRYSGQWIVDGLPRQGLVMQIGELPPGRSYLFLTMFTYRDGSPTWVVGNTDFAVGAHEVTVDMWSLEGGESFTEPLRSYDREDVTQELLGTITIRPRHCNVVDADIDFSTTGFGQVSRRFERLIRIGGYDCDQTR